MLTKQAIYKVYEQDDPEWLDITLNQLQNQDLENINWEHLIKEIIMVVLPMAVNGYSCN